MLAKAGQKGNILQLEAVCNSVQKWRIKYTFKIDKIKIKIAKQCEANTKTKFANSVKTCKSSWLSIYICTVNKLYCSFTHCKFNFVISPVMV